MPSFRPRVSLLSALLLLTIAGMAIVIVQLWREVGPLREEVRGLRNEVGAIAVEDPTKVHAIQIDTGDELAWKWRLWLPENRVYVVRSCGEAIPKNGFPMPSGSIWLREPGEHVLIYRITRDPRNGQWNGRLETNTGSVGSYHHPWVEWTTRASLTDGVGESTEAFAPDKRVEIIRHRISQNSDSTKIEGPAAGFMIWLEPSK